MASRSSQVSRALATLPLEHRLQTSSYSLTQSLIVIPSEEEISAMDKEIQRLGIQMPKFNKIGGLLAKEV
jgi:hypothetical protein